MAETEEVKMVVTVSIVLEAIAVNKDPMYTGFNDVIGCLTIEENIAETADGDGDSDSGTNCCAISKATKNPIDIRIAPTVWSTRI